MKTLLILLLLCTPAMAQVEQCEQACTDRSKLISNGDYLNCVQLCNLNVKLDTIAGVLMQMAKNEQYVKDVTEKTLEDK